MKFTIDISDAILDDLKERIRRTRWPDQVPGLTWEQGTDLGYLKPLLDYWADGFDWRAQERRLNELAHYRTTIDDVAIHFVHTRAAGGSGTPLILTHGWPSTFLEYLPLIPLLPDFDLVIPSLPGYGFSPRPPRVGLNYREVARLWRKLMGSLGYERYGAGGGDFGAGVATFMALDAPREVNGLHLTNFELTPALTEAESAYRAEKERWESVERGYSTIQSTKPQTVGYGLNDSPAGLAAWVLEKWRSWTDSGGDIDARFGRDFLLTMLTIYWATQTITPSLRDYFDNRWYEVSPDYVSVPTAFGVFRHNFVPEGEPPRELMERLYNVRRWTVMPRGGHFAPIEEPELVAEDITAFFNGM